MTKVARRKTKGKKSTENSGNGRRKNRGRVENLKPFPRGVSGNPGGRPKLVSSAYKEWLAARSDPYDPESPTNAERLAEAQGREALQGNVGAAREIRKATEGDVFHFSKMSDDELLAFITGETAAGSAGGSEATGVTNPALSDSPGDQAEV